jgi:hypothetical protein
VLRNKFIAVMIVIFTITFVVLTISSSSVFAQNDCPSQDNVACAQSDLSLPVPSENDIHVPGLQGDIHVPGDQSQGTDEDSGGSDDESNDNGISSGGSTFLLPFP